MIPHKYEGVVRSVPMDAHVGFPCNPVFFAKANMFIKYFQVHSVAGEIHSGQYFQSLDYEDFVRIFLCRFWKRSPYLPNFEDWEA